MSLGIRGKILLFAVLAWTFIFIVYAAHVYRERTAQTERMALTAASLLAKEVQADRRLYSSVVVKRALEAGLTVTTDYHNIERSIPNPTAFLKDVADSIGTRDGFYIELKSINPVNPENGPDDAFERAALEGFAGGAGTRSHTFEYIKGRWSLRYMVPDTATSQVCVDCHNSIPGGPKRDYKVGDLMGAVLITIPVEAEAAMATSDIWRSIAYGLAVVVAIGVLGLAFISRVVTRPMANIADMAGRIADGDLTGEITAGAKDEIGYLSGRINEVCSNLHAMIEEIRRATDEAVGIATALRDSTRTIIETASKEGVSLEEAEKNAGRASSALSEAGKSAEGMASAAKEASASLLDLGSGMDAASEQAATLASSADEISLSAKGMSGAVKDIAGDIEDLFSAVSEVSSATVRINARTREIEVIAAGARKYTEDSVRDAASATESLNSAIRGAESVKEITSGSMGVLTGLCERVKEAASTLDFIRDVSEETNLLAINAAIIAAQSGEHGKSFAVVANEIKDLAEKTTTSAKEVSEIMQAVEAESSRASSEMSRGVEGAERGVSLSARAGEDLKKITESAARSAGAVKEIERAASEEARDAAAAASGAGKVSEMTRSIVSKAQEELRSGDLTVTASGRLSEAARKVRASMRGEAAAKEALAGKIEKILRVSSHINGAIREEARNIGRISESIAVIKRLSSGNLLKAADAGKVAEEMVRLNNELAEKVKRFKLRR